MSTSGSATDRPIRAGIATAGASSITTGSVLKCRRPTIRHARTEGIQVGVCKPTLDNQQWLDNNKQLQTYNNKCLAIDPRDFDSGKQGGAVRQ